MELAKLFTAAEGREFLIFLVLFLGFILSALNPKVLVVLILLGLFIYFLVSLFSMGLFGKVCVIIICFACALIGISRK